MHSQAHDIVIRELGRVIGAVVAFQDVVAEEFPVLERKIGEHSGADRPSQIASHGRLHIID